MKVGEVLRTGFGRSPVRAPAVLLGQDDGFRFRFGNGRRGQGMRGYRHQGTADIAQQSTKLKPNAGDSFVMASERHHHVHVILPDYSTEARMGSASADDAPIRNPEGRAQGIQPVHRRIGGQGARGLFRFAQRRPATSGRNGGIKDKITPGLFRQGLRVFR